MPLPIRPSDRAQSRASIRAKALGALLPCAALLYAAATLPATANAATTIIDEPFTAGWSGGTTWSIAGNGAPNVVTTSGQTPTSVLRLTPAVNSRAGAVSYTLAQPTRGGLDVTFKQSQWGDTAGVGAAPAGADGIVFFLRKGSDPSNATGALGGAMGYSTQPSASAPGMPGGLVGIGLDLYGNYAQNSLFGGTNCTDGTSGTNSSNSIAIRGPGSGTTGYCRLGIANGTVSGQAITFAGSGNTRNATRAAGTRSIRVTVDPSTQANPKVTIYYGPDGTGTNLTQVLQVNAPAELMAESTFKFGFSAGTGGANNNHEIWGLSVQTLVDLPPVQITTPSLPDGAVGGTYACTPIVNEDGVAPVSTAIEAGALPDGLTLNAATSEVCGTPTRAGTFTFTAKATDSRGPTESMTTRQYTISVADVDPPCAPVDLAATPGVQKATLSWKPDPTASCPGITSYEVELSNGQTCRTTFPTATCDLTGLAPGTPVRFRVRAVNGVGPSAWSNYSAEFTPLAPPAAAVTIPTIKVAPGAIVTIVRAKGPGRAVLGGTVGGRQALIPGVHVFTKAGTATIRAALNPRTRALLRTRDIRVRITLRFTTPSGQTTIATRTVLLKRTPSWRPAVTG